MSMFNVKPVRAPRIPTKIVVRAKKGKGAYSRKGRRNDR